MRSCIALAWTGRLEGGLKDVGSVHPMADELTLDAVTQMDALARLSQEINVPARN
jgi:hypothetical protein